jgi:DNA-directed RNA polymerase specialized sigma24 family protein
MIDNFVRLVVKSNEKWVGNSMTDPNEPLNAEADPWRVFEDEERDIVEQFRSLQEKLTIYFEARHCIDPEELADETLERVVRKLCEGTEVLDLKRYSYGVAKNVFYEYLRRERVKHQYSDEQRYRPEPKASGDVVDMAKERRLDCLEACSGRLKEEARWILYEYYRYNGQHKLEHRKKMAEKLNITREALTLRVFHLKQKLRKCINDCLENR